MICEMCNSNDLVKQDGMFVCQNCGTKYSVEEAKKLLGTVVVDKTAETEKLFVLARRGKENDDSENAAKYYEMILLENPSSWEASFYSVYFTAKACKIANIEAAANNVSNCLNSVLSLVKDNVPETDQLDIVKEIANQCVIISTLFITAANNTYYDISSDIQYKFSHDRDERLRASLTMLENCGNQIESVFDGNATIQEQAVIPWEAFIELCKDNNWSDEWERRAGEKIAKYDSDYYASFKKRMDAIDAKRREAAERFSQKQNSGCYVATAVYGSYDCPEVWTLRRYRDDTLAETWYGRAFIHTYYAISPTLVKWFGASDWFKNMWKPKLDNMVKKLWEQGVEDTPYNDKRW